MTYKVPKKPLENVVLDLDDFVQNPANNCLDFLMDLKLRYPKFKVTLFGIPFYKDRYQYDFFEMVNKAFGDWIQIGIHGWKHNSVKECEKWNYDTAYQRIKVARDIGCFVPVFKAPGWNYSNPTYKVCNKLDVIVCTKLDTDKVNKYYSLEHPWCVHGHTWNLNNPDKSTNNGIEQIIERGVPWNKDTKFHFITELYE